MAILAICYSTHATSCGDSFHLEGHASCIPFLMDQAISPGSAREISGLHCRTRFAGGETMRSVDPTIGICGRVRYAYEVVDHPYHPLGNPVCFSLGPLPVCEDAGRMPLHSTRRP